jgi:hypothetical protein
MLAMWAFMTFGLVTASAEPSTNLQVTANASVTDSSLTVAGSVRTFGGQGISGLPLTVALNDAAVGTTVTGPDGSYSYSGSRPQPSSYVVRVSWAGDSRYAAKAGVTQITVNPASKAATSLTLTLDPPEAEPGASVGISGQLLSGGAPLGSALVSLAADQGDIDAMAVTAVDGTFSAMVVLPEGQVPAQYTVTATYAGDDVYEASKGQAVGTITTPPTPAETPPAAADPVPTPAATPTTTATPTPAIAAARPAGTSASMEIVRVAFFTVAIVAAGALLILAIISNARKRLARGERRGFGTDFGKPLR